MPLVVGGTMLYAKALRDGLSALPSADADVRARIEARAREHGWPALHAELARLDPATAARLPAADSQRIQRALEVIELTGTPLSQLQHAPRKPDLTLTTIALLPADRADLHRRIEQRFDAMLAAGFLDEVRALMARGDLDPDLPRCAASVTGRPGRICPAPATSPSFAPLRSPPRASWPSGR
jgi:tRNA dimethylallyltransferase